MKEFTDADILKAFPSLYYVIDLDTKSVVKSNDPEVKINESQCFEYLYGRETQCIENQDNCICRKALEQGKSSCIIEKERNRQKEFYNARLSRLDKNRVVVNLENVTGEYRIKKELKINTKRLERAAKLADIGHWEFNIDDKIVIVSNGAKNIYGLPSNRIELGKFKAYTVKKFRKRLDMELEELITKRKPYNIKYQIKRPTDGEMCHIHSIAEFREDKRMVFGVIHDITESSRIQNALAENEDNLKQLFQNMNSAFASHKIVTDKSGTPVDYIFLEVNDKFQELTGLKREEIINKPVSEVLPNTEKYWIERFGNVAITGEPSTFTDYSSEIGKYFEVSVYSPKKKYFAVTFTDVTDRVKSEIALKESYEDQRMAQEIAKIGCWKYNPAKKEVSWSEQVFKIFERDPSMGVIDLEDYKEFFSEQEFDKLSDSFRNFQANDVPIDLKLKLKLPNSKSKWIEVICNPPEKTEHREGNILRGIIRDITSRKETEEEISNTGELLRTVIDNISDAIYMKDSQFRKLIANKGDAINSGVSDVSELIGKSDYDLYPKEVADVYTEDDRRVIEGGKAVINREEILPGKDKDRVILTSKFPLRNKKNKIIGLVGIGRDITEMKENQARLNLLQQTVQQTPLPVIITDINGNIEYVNPGFTKVTGYEFDEIVGKNPRILNSGLEDSANSKELWQTITSGKNWYGEFHNKKKDGSLYWENAVIAPIIDEHNEINHFVAVKEDITEKKQIIGDLKESKEKAEEADRLKTIFLANISHEIRTPLNIILGFSNIISSGNVKKEKLDYFGKIIEESGGRLINMIDDIIDISMVQTDQVKLDYSEFEMDELLLDLYDMFKLKMAGQLNEIDFKVKLCENPVGGRVQADKVRLRQVFEHLIENAFKFTGKGKIDFGCHDLKKDSITIFVSDTGIGIERDKTELIFKAFRQAEEGDARKFEGSGLGLAIAKGIMDLMGGEIKVESKVGKGSTFYVTFPTKRKK